ncbi:MAG: glycosyltransferase family 2 protein [Gemmatimonas sp.]
MVSLIVPAMNEADGIGEFCRRASAMLRGLDGLDYELVFVDDGSTDATFEKLCALAAADSRIRVIKFSRNFGHQVAITAGLDAARGDCLVVIDADLQDPPEVIPEMIDKWHEGFDVVYAQRLAREGESGFKRMTAAAFYRLFRGVTRMDIPVDVGDFRLMSRRAADHLRSMREKDRFVRGLVSWIGFRQIPVHYRRDARFAGTTKYPFRKMLRFAIDAITSFSTAPLRIATWFGFMASMLAFAYVASVPFQWYFGITVSGFATIVMSILFLGGVQLICLGIIGEYVGRIYTELKPRPMYIVEQTVESRDHHA